MASSTDDAVVTVWPADVNARRMNVTVAGWSSTIRINMGGAAPSAKPGLRLGS
jgi:hypothetical protein